jgi:dipeptidyl aminopeptidase/acylaminoacyl peptidase
MRGSGGSENVNGIRNALGTAIVALALACPAAYAGDTATAPAGVPPAATKPPASLVQVLGRLPTLEQVSVSPGGTRIVYISATGELRALAVWTIADRKITFAARLGDTKVRSIDWADEDHVILTYSTTSLIMDLEGWRREWRMATICDIARASCTGLKFAGRTDEDMMNVVVDGPWIRRVNGQTTAFVAGIVFQNNEGRRALFSVDLKSGRANIVARGTRDAEDWLLDADGKIAAELDYTDRTRTYTVRLRDAEGRLVPAADLDAPTLLGLTADGTGVVVRTFDEDEVRFVVVSFADRSVKPYPNALRSAEPLLDRLTGRVIGFRSEHRMVYSFVDPAIQRRWDSTAAALKGTRVRLESYTDDFSRLLLLTDRPDDGLMYRMLDWSTHRVDPVGDQYAGLETYAERRAYSYKAGDGLEIPGFLTLPRGREPKALPLVLLPHGGPASEEGEDFDWWSQALASRGYAVLQPNFRGSTVSQEMREAGNGEYGRKMQTDLSDGVKALVAAGVVDPARVCIVGASYGGYAALAGVTLEPDVYRCAVSVSGISDPGRFVRWVNFEHTREGGDQRPVRYWLRFMGMKDVSDPKFAEISPIDHVDAIRAPVLLIHGKDDTVVPIEQSEKFAEALKARHKPVEFVLLKKEDHWLSHGETRLQMLEETVRFLERHNPPQ